VVCADNAIVLDAGAGFISYLWSNGASVSSIMIDSSGVGIGTTTVSVTVTDANGCSNSDTMDITFDLCAGIAIASDNFNSLSVYPNPFSQNFKFESGKIISYFVYDGIGQLIEYNDSFSGQITLGENYIPGVYYVEVIFKAEKKIYQLVKIH
jgi:hypothetical protein